MFEKDVQIIYVKPYNFKNDTTGEILKGCKVAYSYADAIESSNEKGYKTDFANLDYSYADKLMSAELPLLVKGKLSVNSKNILKLVDIVL